MKELVELLWRSLAQYLPVLVAVVSAPRVTILSLVDHAGALPSIR